jgi:hypothetical protein
LRSTCKGEREIARCTISELDPRITQFRIEVRSTDDAPWQTAFEGGRAGKKFEASFPPVRARHARLHILDATFAPTIWEFELFGPAK